MAAMLFIDTHRCRLCRRCLARQVCKTKAIIRLDREDPPMIDLHLCRDCRICMKECPFQAVRLAGSPGRH